VGSSDALPAQLKLPIMFQKKISSVDLTEAGPISTKSINHWLIPGVYLIPSGKEPVILDVSEEKQ